jgi:hypothetical protein
MVRSGEERSAQRDSSPLDRTIDPILCPFPFAPSALEAYPFGPALADIKSELNEGLAWVVRPFAPLRLVDDR